MARAASSTMARSSCRWSNIFFSFALGLLFKQLLPSKSRGDPLPIVRKNRSYPPSPLLPGDPPTQIRVTPSRVLSDETFHKKLCRNLCKNLVILIFEVGGPRRTPPLFSAKIVPTPLAGGWGGHLQRHPDVPRPAPIAGYQLTFTTIRVISSNWGCEPEKTKTDRIISSTIT